MTAAPPRCSTASAMAGASVATNTRPSLAAKARRHTCTIIGSPAMSASGLPGSRVEAMRAGMRMTMSGIGSASRARLYGLQQARQTGYLCAALPLPSRSFPSMNSFELNKILGALLGTCLVLLAVHIASGAIFAPQVPAKPGYVIEVKQEQQPANEGGGAAAAAHVPIETLLASASTERGTQVAKQCQSCHNLGKGQGNKIGPNLYGVVGRKVAAESGFHYSPQLKAMGGTWTFDAL